MNDTDRLGILFFDQAFCSIPSLFNKFHYGIKYISLIKVSLFYHPGDDTLNFSYLNTFVYLAD
jgi:hypothetical protein